MPWVHVEDAKMAPPPLEIIVPAPEVVDAINRRIEELTASRVSVTQELTD